VHFGATMVKPAAPARPAPKPVKRAPARRPAGKKLGAKRPAKPLAKKKPTSKKPTAKRTAAKKPGVDKNTNKQSIQKNTPARPARDKRDPHLGAAPGVLQGPAAHAARGELSPRPYAKLTADQLSGPDDLRLDKVHRQATTKNVEMTRKLAKTLDEAGVEGAHVYGRAKDKVSLFNKLRETPGMKLGDVKDVSGVRADITPTKPAFGDVKQAQKAVTETFGDAAKLKGDYITNPNKWGYTGRIHDIVDNGGMPHEVQLGSKDISKFIDQKLTTKGGHQISLHDTTFYKGDTNGARLPQHLEKEYTSLMGRIRDANAAGKSADEVPELARDLKKFKDAAEEALPAKLLAKPDPKLSTKAKVGRAAGKVLGVAGVVGGAMQTADGVQELRDGKYVEGGADVVAGGGSIASSAALMAGRVGLGTTTGGAVAVVDGAKDIYVGIRDGNVEKGVTGAVKSGAGAAMIAGVATANPVLIAGGAVAYGGAVVYENRKAIAGAAKKAWNWVKSWW
jgi:hypothetical protein